MIPFIRLTMKLLIVTLIFFRSRHYVLVCIVNDFLLSKVAYFFYQFHEFKKSPRQYIFVLWDIRVYNRIVLPTCITKHNKENNINRCKLTIKKRNNLFIIITILNDTYFGSQLLNFILILHDMFKYVLGKTVNHKSYP